jgi:hypothetical protein
MTDRCNECKVELSADSRFCQNCGVRIGFRKDVYNDVIADGHWIAEERPDFLIKQLASFFSE